MVVSYISNQDGGGGDCNHGSCYIPTTCVLIWSDLISTLLCHVNLVGTCAANYPANLHKHIVCSWGRCTHHFIHSFTGQGRGRREYGWYRDMYKKNDDGVGYAVSDSKRQWNEQLQFPPLQIIPRCLKSGFDMYGLLLLLLLLI